MSDDLADQSLLCTTERLAAAASVVFAIALYPFAQRNDAS
jgi:hypothetical protein